MIAERAKASGWAPADVALLMEAAGEGAQGPATVEPSLVAMRHPLDGLPEGQIQALFKAAGLRADDYRPRKP